MAKTIIYQIFTRLFGNTNETRKPNGTIFENGCGKFDDINDAALDSIASLGVTHVWYTGIIRHASTTNYAFMRHRANANVVKGRAGSPYAICDYYDVDPDLANNVDHRMNEFTALLQRTHQHGLKCIIDFVPNHVARNYFSDSFPDKPQFGQLDDPSKRFSPSNNFYYTNEPFVSPINDLDEPYIESPAKASGNDAFTARPSCNDWYETVKLNYGRDYATGQLHTQPMPDTWFKMRDILLYWASTGIDGFRVDMAEMVPVEFWQWVIAQVTTRYPDVTFIAETYDPHQYRSYIEAGFNLLYDKVNFYDTVRDVICNRRWASDITNIWHTTEGLGPHMLYFLENHDEQRIASDFFAGNALKARPGMLLAALMGQGGAMLYFGQELGEAGMDEEGFSGRDGRTTIFDYWGVQRVQQFVNNHLFDGAKLPDEARNLRQWYAHTLSTIQQYDTLSSGEFYDLMWTNTNPQEFDASRLFAFLRYEPQGDRFLVVLNFADEKRTARVHISPDAWQLMGLATTKRISPIDILGNAQVENHATAKSITDNGLNLTIPALDGIILKI